LVFGLETTIRALKRNRFEPRRKWTTTICIAVVAVLEFLTWLPTVISPSNTKCFGDIIWRPIKYSLVAMVILNVLIVALVVMTIIIGVRLSKTVNIEPAERIAASRMFYYLIAATILHVSLSPTLNL